MLAWIGRFALPAHNGNYTQPAVNQPTAADRVERRIAKPPRKLHRVKNKTAAQPRRQTD